MAEMSPHPTRSDIWGLKNVSATTWTGISPNGKSISIPSGKSLSLIPGVRHSLRQRRGDGALKRFIFTDLGPGC